MTNVAIIKVSEDSKNANVESWRTSLAKYVKYRTIFA